MLKAKREIDEWNTFYYIIKAMTVYISKSLLLMKKYGKHTKKLLPENIKYLNIQKIEILN